jgi:putative ABC transport system permease protein
MGTLLKLAFRNVFRAKKRTIITFSSISIGLGLLIFIISLMRGIDKQSISNIIHSQTSHLKLFKTGYFDKKDEIPLNKTITNPEQYYAKIKEHPQIKEVESRILFGASLIKGMDELPCLGVACEPESDPRILNIKDSLVAGTWINSEKSGMVMGVDMAEDIGVKIGDYVTIRVITSSKGEDYSWNALDMEIIGIFNSGNPTVDSNRIIVPLNFARDALTLENKATEIVVCLINDKEKTLQEAQNYLTELFKQNEQNIEVYTWKDLAGTFLAISKMKTKSSSMIIMIMLIIASIGIINTMLMAVFERTREIGMLMAMGMKKKEILQLFVIEGGFIGVFGSLLGCILGSLAGWYMETKGWSISVFGETYEKVAQAAYPIKDVFYGDLSFDIVLNTFIFGVVISIVASLYPALKATKLNPIEALRHI